MSMNADTMATEIISAMSDVDFTATDSSGVLINGADAALETLADVVKSHIETNSAWEFSWAGVLQGSPDPTVSFTGSIVFTSFVLKPYVDANPTDDKIEDGDVAMDDLASQLATQIAGGIITPADGWTMTMPLILSPLAVKGSLSTSGYDSQSSAMVDFCSKIIECVKATINNTSWAGTHNGYVGPAVMLSIS